MNPNIIVYGIDFFSKIFTFEYEQCYDYDVFKNSKSFKILIKREDIFYNNIIYNIEKRVVLYNKLSCDCDLLFVWCDELHYYHYNSANIPCIMKKLCKNKKIVFIIPGITHSNFITVCNLAWIKQCVDVYKNLQYKLKELSPYTEKEFFFDALMGTIRTHREFVYNKILNSNIQNRILCSYKNNAASDNWFKDDDLSYNLTSIDENKTYSNLPVQYHGKSIWISHQIPISVFNKSAYSLITETEFLNGISFPTEKITKPLLAKRLFIVFSGQYFLKFLQNLGFKTFESLIDESYDSELHNETRWQMAWDQIEKLSKSNQQEIFKKIEPIVEHNFNHLMYFPFDDFVKKQCTEILVNRYYESQRIYS